MKTATEIALEVAEQLYNDASQSWREIGIIAAFAPIFLARIDAERGKDVVAFIHPVHLEHLIQRKNGFCGMANYAPVWVEQDGENTVSLFLSAPTIPEGMTLVPTEILDRFPEINPSNYDHDDACALNAWGGVELVLAAAQGERK